MSSGERPILFCFSNNLRLSDNAALHAARNTGRPILCCYVADNNRKKAWQAGAASRWWLHHSLTSLDKTLSAIGGRLVVRQGDWLQEVFKLACDINASAVYWSRSYEPNAAANESQLHKQLSESGIEARRFKGYLLFEPENIRTGNGEPYKVFTPFWKACLRQADPAPPLPTPADLPFYPCDEVSLSIDSLGLTPKRPDWAGGLRQSWQPGEAGADICLSNFLDSAAFNYADGRDFPATCGTSMLSPHLHFGELSPRQIWHAVKSRLFENSRLQVGADAYLRQLGWRDFCSHLLYQWPQLPDKPFKLQFSQFPWRRDSEALRAWQRGETGIPIIDAGMRQLWHTGWMHNRVRMIAASFLVKNLLVHWREGEQWFWDTLVDADLANNAAGWQWVAGSGADAAPYFRIFNSVTQSKKFDTDGEYIRRWVPELGKLPSKHIHAPWETPTELLKESLVTLGNNYPLPIVELKQSRERALECYQKLRSQ